MNYYAKAAKIRLELALKRAKQLLDINKLNQKNNYDRNILDLRNNVTMVDEIADKKQIEYKNKLKLYNSNV